MKKPFFSIIIPTLNEEKFLPHLLDSLVVQTNKDFEVIVVDGKSKDNTVQIAKTYISQLPSLVVCVADRASLPHQRNIGAETAKGSWFVFVDADTVLLPYTLERIYHYIKFHDVHILTSWFTPDSEEDKDARFIVLTHLLFESFKMIKRTTAPGPFSVVERDAFYQVGKYDVEHPFLEDQDFSRRATKIGFSIDIIRETLYIWSLRRYRKEGTFRVVQEYMKTILPILFLGKTPKNLVGYAMGGHVFSKRKPTVKQSLLKKAEKQIRSLMQDLFE
ncbi:MAG: glycosyl transferase GT2 family [Microgenomates group bacterium GW2011_GWC1_39_12]|nr:MAG: glycosyl transferase GT2 family [Microgenomates group bacterium GW2011_GWC1_39_12]